MIKRFVDTVIEKLFWRVISNVVDKALNRDALNIERFLRRRALEETADFVVKNMRATKSFADRWKLLAHGVAQVNTEGSFAEFGVWRGESLNFIASITDRTIYGFDSFEGLPEDWIFGYTKEKFRLDAMPSVRESVSLVKGWYKESLPKFLAAHDDYFAFLHIDCDLYSSTKTVFDLLADRLNEGTVIVFDEFFNYPGWKDGGEYKAFMEFVAKNAFDFEYIGYTLYGPCVAVKLGKRTAAS